MSTNFGNICPSVHHTQILEHNLSNVTQKSLDVTELYTHENMFHVMYVFLRDKTTKSQLQVFSSGVGEVKVWSSLKMLLLWQTKVKGHQTRLIESMTHAAYRVSSPGIIVPGYKKVIRGHWNLPFKTMSDFDQVCCIMCGLMRREKKSSTCIGSKIRKRSRCKNVLFHYQGGKKLRG